MSVIIQPPTLAGRASELKFLQERLDSALSGRGSLVLIAGEAGIGKSRLAEEFSKGAEDKGCRVMVGRCLPGAPTAYLPFQDAFRQSQAVDFKSGLGLSRWLRGPKPERSGAGIKHSGFGFVFEYEGDRVPHAMLELLGERAQKQAILLVLEDLHWADTASTKLLHFLARNIGEIRVLIVGSYRPEELVPEAGATIHPLRDTLRIMRREGISHEIQLDRLEAEELGIALQSMFKGPIDSELIQRIMSETGGNPLFAVEMVHLLLQTKSITTHAGLWTISEKVQLDIPSTVREVILRRIERMPMDERRILDCAAVVGESFDPAIVEEVLKIERMKLLEILESIENTLQLVKAENSHYRFNHEKVRQVTYDQISTPRRKELHRGILYALETRKHDESLWAQLSTHSFNGGQMKTCAKYSLLAGQSCIEHTANSEAADYFRRTLDVSRDEPSLLEDRQSALEGLGDAQRRLGLYNSAATSYSDFLTLSKTPKDRARVLRKEAGCYLSYGKTDLSKARELLDQAQAYSDVEALEVGRLKRARASLAFGSRKVSEGERLLQEARETFERTNAVADLAATLLQEAWLYISHGRPGEAIGGANRAAQLFSKMQDRSGEAQALHHLGDAYLHLGSTKEALEYLAKAEEIHAKSDNYELIFWDHWCTANAYHSIQQFDSGRTEALKALEYASKMQSPSFHASANAMTALNEIPLGDLYEAESRCREASDNVRMATESDLPGFLPPILNWSWAELFAARREWAASSDRFQQSIKLCQGADYGLFIEARTRARFSEILAMQGRPEAIEQRDAAINLYRKLGNLPQVERISKLSQTAEKA